MSYNKQNKETKAGSQEPFVHKLTQAKPKQLLKFWDVDQNDMNSTLTF